MAEHTCTAGAHGAHPNDTLRTLLVCLGDQIGEAVTVAAAAEMAVEGMNEWHRLPDPAASGLMWITGEARRRVEAARDRHDDIMAPIRAAALAARAGGTDARPDAGAYDSELLGLEREAEAALAAADAGGTDAEVEAALARAHELEGHIAAIPARSVVGVLVKLRRLARHAAELGGDNEGYIHSKALYSGAVEALSRIAAGAGRGAPPAG